MSALVHVFRAEKLAAAIDEHALAAVRQSGQLGGFRSEAGCDPLFVYLLKRWSSVFDSGGPAKLEASESFQDAVVDAYVAAGCALDGLVATRGFADHTSTSFRMMVRLPGKLSPRSFVTLLRKELRPDMFPALSAQLEKLDVRLASHANGTFVAVEPRGTDGVSAVLVLGVRTAADPAALAELRAGAKPLGLEVVVSGDPPAGAVAELVVGRELARADADDGGPIPASGLEAPAQTEAQTRFLEALGPIHSYLVATGPLATARLVRGAPGTRAAAGAGRFVVGQDQEQTPHTTGVWGELVASATDTPRACELDGAELFLIASYG